jgi:hypothetical protein
VIDSSYWLGRPLLRSASTWTKIDWSVTAHTSWPPIRLSTLIPRLVNTMRDISNVNITHLVDTDAVIKPELTA